MTANAGYHVYNTGDVLTSAQVQYNLQNQTVMYFADTTTRDTALSGKVVEGMVSYTPATGLMYYNGSAWTTVGGSVPTSYGFTAGKNRIINGDFNINQRNFTSNTTNNTYNFDRFVQLNGGTSGTLTVTPQAFTPGTAPVVGYEAKQYVQCITASGANIDTYAIYQQTIEDVRTFAAQTATISFWAKTNSGTPKVAVEITQAFGTGGSPSSQVSTYVNQVTLSTSWTRYSVSIAVPSISGKTIGTDPNTSSLSVTFWMSAGSNYNARTGSLGLQNGTFQFWGVQIEAGSSATSFQTATGTIQGELAACQRYYQNIGNEDMWGAYSQSTQVAWWYKNAVTMRTNPTPTYPSNLTNIIDKAGIGTASATSIVTGNTNPTVCLILANGAGSASVGQPAGYIGSAIQLSAEF